MPPTAVPPPASARPTSTARTRQSSTELGRRAARHAALGDPARLAIADELTESDLAPSEPARRLGLGSNLLAHHLDVMEAAGLVTRRASTADGRRRYVVLRSEAMATLGRGLRARGVGDALFVCTQNSARSQLAAALWRELTGHEASSAGTDPAAAVHPAAIAAAARAGLDLTRARPRSLDAVGRIPPFVVTVCDAAHETVGAARGWRHWSIDDPARDGRAAAFDRAVAVLRSRIELAATEAA